MLKNFNWYGCYTLYKKENKRFYRTYNQTITSCIASSLTFFAVLILTIGRQDTSNWPLHPRNFIVCGLVMQILMQASFKHTAASMVLAKMTGYIDDLLFPPLNSNVILLAYLSSALTRATIVGVVLMLSLLPFTQTNAWILHFWELLYFSLTSSAILALLGTIIGIVSSNFEQVSLVTSYTVMPLSFLSCMFYSAKNLPEIVQKINLCNPFFYLMDGFRYSLTGYAECSKTLSISVTFVSTVLLLFITKILLDSGYGIKK